MELRQLGSGWFPKITRKAFNRLKKYKDTGVYPFAFIVDKALSTENSVAFHVKKGAGAKRTGTEIRFGADAKAGRLLEGHGTFLINFEAKTIQKIGIADTGIE